MKKLLLFSLAISIGFFSFSQERINVKTSPVKLEYRKAIKDISKFENPYNPYVRTTEFSPIETQIGETQYDLQTNGSTQNRIFLYLDCFLDFISILIKTISTKIKFLFI